MIMAAANAPIAIAITPAIAEIPATAVTPAIGYTYNGRKSTPAQQSRT
jgi:hypothetical protein